MAFLCERVVDEETKRVCGHDLAVHNPCSASYTVLDKNDEPALDDDGNEQQRPCDCPGFEPDDIKMRVATLTDFPPELKNASDPRQLARALRGERTYSTPGRPTR